MLYLISSLNCIHCHPLVSNHLDIGQTTIDPVTSPNHKRRTQRVYGNRKKKRLENCSSAAHHKQVKGRFNEFLYKYSKEKPRFETVYDYYLDCACCNLETHFNCHNSDPMLSSNMREYTLRIKRMRDALDRFKKNEKKTKLPLQNGFRLEFYKKTRKEQENILITLRFEYLNANIKYNTCTSCHSKTLGMNFSGDAAKVCNKCVNLHKKNDDGRVKFYLENNMLPVWYDKDNKIHY
jgi:hypothetical protein